MLHTNYTQYEGTLLIRKSNQSKLYIHIHTALVRMKEPFFNRVEKYVQMKLEEKKTLGIIADFVND